MSDAVLIALITTVLGGGGLIIKWLESRKDHSPIDRDAAEVALAQQSVEVAGASMAFMQQQLDAVARAQEAAQTASNERYASIEAELNKVRGEVREVRTVTIVHVAPLIKWIDDGAPPPPPEIHEDLRQMILALTNRESEYRQ